MENSDIGRVESNPCAQKAEIVALTKAMEISTDQVVNIYTDSIYAYGQVVQNWIPRNLKPVPKYRYRQIGLFYFQKGYCKVAHEEGCATQP